MFEKRPNRIVHWRGLELKPDEKKVLENIETHGCHIVQVREDQAGPGWSYTIGLYERLGCPEIIVLGLKDLVAAHVLNDAAGRMRDGAIFHERDRHVDLLENVECEFRAVDSKWLKQGLMGYANWFYGTPDYPVMQCVYPDIAGIFPWEAGFDQTWRGRQPLVFPGAPESSAEQDLWARHDPSSCLYSWNLPLSPHTGVFATRHVANGEEAILLVSHDRSDGAWQFIGTSDGNSGNIAHLCLHHILDLDPTLAELCDLPLGWMARRKNVSAPWAREICPPNEEVG